VKYKNGKHKKRKMLIIKQQKVKDGLVQMKLHKVLLEMIKLLVQKNSSTKSNKNNNKEGENK